VFALSETGGTLVDLGPLVAAEPDVLCRAELRVESPAGVWAVRLASPISDDPDAVLWDSAGLLVVRYGFVAYALDARDGSLRWQHRSGTPLVAVLGSSRLDHVLVQSEVETFAIDRSGVVAWRAAHSDVVAGAELVGGRLVLTSFDGQVRALDPATGQATG
jgi:outer membrane protein assembly factor BamB